MYQNRATLFETLDKAATDTINHPTSLSGSSSRNEWPRDQAKRKSSKRYVPVYHVELVRDRLIKVEPRPAIHNADDVVAILRDELLKADREKLICLMLNTKNIVIGMEIVSVGSLTASVAHPRLCSQEHNAEHF
jgi:RadC-like JAB domain